MALNVSEDPKEKKPTRKDGAKASSCLRVAVPFVRMLLKVIYPKIFPKVFFLPGDRRLLMDRSIISANGFDWSLPLLMVTEYAYFRIRSSFEAHS